MVFVPLPVNILLLNPNTNRDVTKHVESKVSEALTVSFIDDNTRFNSLHANKTPETASPTFRCYSKTASFGKPYISDEQSYAVASHAVLEKSLPYLKSFYEKKHPRNEQFSPRPVDVILLCCFGDPGIFAVREASQQMTRLHSQSNLVEVEPVPVIGLAEASILYAIAKTKRKIPTQNGGLQSKANISIVTGGSKWKPILERLISNLGYNDLICNIKTIELTGDQIRSRPKEAAQALAKECFREVKDQPTVDTIILGGAGLCGLKSDIGEYLSRRFGITKAITLIDSVEAGALVAYELGLRFKDQKNTSGIFPEKLSVASKL